MARKCFEFDFSTAKEPHFAYGGCPRTATNAAFHLISKDHFTPSHRYVLQDFQLKLGEEMTIKIKRLS